MFKTNDEYTKLYSAVKALLLDKKTKEQLADMIADDCVRKVLEDDGKAQFQPELDAATLKIERLNTLIEKQTEQRYSDLADRAIQLYVALHAAPKKFAQTGASGKAAKIAPVREYAFLKFDELAKSQSKPNFTQIAKEIWPEVFKLSIKHGCQMTETTGPTTLRNWLVAHAKTKNA